MVEESMQEGPMSTGAGSAADNMIRLLYLEVVRKMTTSCGKKIHSFADSLVFRRTQLMSSRRKSSKNVLTSLISQ
jgi:hypothetical protein